MGLLCLIHGLFGGVVASCFWSAWLPGKGYFQSNTGDFGVWWPPVLGSLASQVIFLLHLSTADNKDVQLPSTSMESRAMLRMDIGVDSRNGIMAL